VARSTHTDDADYLLADLVAAESWHFWFRSRRRLAQWAIERSFTEMRSILEVGCGTGFLLGDLQSHAPTLTLAGCDILFEALEYARSRLTGVSLFQADAGRLPVRRRFDVVMALDVIEHLDDDREALREMYRVVEPGGGLLLTVPQHQWLWSATDEFSRHRRRYDRADLLAKTRAAGFEILRCTSFFTTTLPMIALHRVLHGRRESAPVAEVRISKAANAFAEAVLKPEWWLIKAGVSLPIGSSLMVVARRPLDAAPSSPVA
jgi:SAM-dependent methyltransferase